VKVTGEEKFWLVAGLVGGVFLSFFL